MKRLWLLDTCVISEPTRRQPDPAVGRWLERHLGESAIAAVSLGELAYGIERLPPSVRRNALEAWAAAVHERMGDRTLVTDASVWATFGRLRASLEAIGRPQDLMDLLIAATAIAHGLTLVTRNTRHFEDTGVPLLNPWTPTTQ